MLFNPHPKQEATINLFSNLPPKDKTVDEVTSPKEIIATAALHLSPRNKVKARVLLIPPKDKTVDEVTSPKEIIATAALHLSPKVAARVLLLPPKDKTILQNEIVGKVALLPNLSPRNKITVRPLLLSKDKAAPPNEIATKVALLLCLKTEANQLNEKVSNRRQKKSISLH